MYDAFIFDMDGTIFQTEKILEPSLEDTFNRLRSLGLWSGKTPINQYRQIMGVPLPVVWETLLPHHNDEVRSAANNFFHQRLIENINEGKGALHRGTTELFLFLKQKRCRLFIASNGQTEYLNAIVNFYNLGEWVTETRSVQTIPTHDKCDLVQAIVKAYNIQNGVVVGDRLSDFAAAKNNGLFAIGCNFYFAQPEELAKADLVIDSFAGLIEGLKTSETFLKMHSED